MSKRHAWALLLVLATAPRLWGQAELVRDILPGQEGSFPFPLLAHRDEIRITTLRSSGFDSHFSLNPSTGSFRTRQLSGPQGSAVFTYPLLQSDDVVIGYVNGTFQGPTPLTRVARIDFDSDRYALLDSVYTSPYTFANHGISDEWLFETVVRYSDSSYSFSQTISVRAYDPQARRWHRIFPLPNNNLGIDTCYISSGTLLGQHWLMAAFTPPRQFALSYDVVTGVVDTVSNPGLNNFTWFPNAAEYYTARFDGRYFVTQQVTNPRTLLRNDELFEYLPTQRRLVPVLTAGPSDSERSFGQATRMGSLLLFPTASRVSNDRAAIIAFEPSTGRHRRIAELPPTLNRYHIKQLLVVGHTVYLELGDRFGLGFSSLSHLYRMDLPAGFSLSDRTSTFEIRQVQIPQLTPADTLSFGLCGMTENWLYVTGYLGPVSQARNDLYALHLPTRRWLSTRSMNNGNGGSLVFYSLPVELGGDLYFAAQRDDVGNELFKFRSDGLTPHEPDPSVPLFAVSPNPTTGRVSLAAPDGIGAVGYRLLNATGQEIASGSADRPGVEVQLSRALSAAAPGLYVVNLTVGGRSEVHRVLRTSN